MNSDKYSLEELKKIQVPHDEAFSAFRKELYENAKKQDKDGDKDGEEV